MSDGFLSVERHRLTNELGLPLASMRIAFYQADGHAHTRTERLRCMEEQTSAAAQQGAQLVIFPECYADGYPPIDGSMADAVAHIEAGCVVMAETLELVCGLARRYAIAILYGHVDRAPEAVYTPATPFANAATLVEACSGQALLTYHKMHTGTWHPERSFSRGNSFPPIVELHGIQVAVIICYDTYFPETFRHLKHRGAQLVLSIWASTSPTCVEAMSISRALENELAIVSVDYAAPFEGGSCYVDAAGRVVKMLPKQTVALEVVQVDVHDMRAERTFDPVLDLSPLLAPFMSEGLQASASNITQ